MHPLVKAGKAGIIGLALLAIFLAMNALGALFVRGIGTAQDHNPWVIPALLGGGVLGVAVLYLLAKPLIEEQLGVLRRMREYMQRGGEGE